MEVIHRFIVGPWALGAAPATYRPWPPGSNVELVTPHTVRTVAEVMSSPVVTALPDETVAEAATRMQRAGVGSVVVVDGERPIGILTERDLVRFAAAGAAAAGHQGRRVDDRRPRRASRPTCRCRRRSPRSPSTATATSRWSTTDELVGIVSMRDLMRVAADPAGGAPGHDRGAARASRA